jgi:hypothetical protein
MVQRTCFRVTSAPRGAAPFLVVVAGKKKMGKNEMGTIVAHVEWCFPFNGQANDVSGA